MLMCTLTVDDLESGQQEFLSTAAPSENRSYTQNSQNQLDQVNISLSQDYKQNQLLVVTANGKTEEYQRLFGIENHTLGTSSSLNPNDPNCFEVYGKAGSASYISLNYDPALLAAQRSQSDHGEAVSLFPPPATPITVGVES